MVFSNMDKVYHLLLGVPHVVTSNPTLYNFNKGLPSSDHRLYVNQFNRDGIVDVDTTSVHCIELV